MFEEFVLIDTNVWHYAYKKPKEKEFVEIHEKAKLFLKGVFKDERKQVVLSVYQIGEIIEVFRKSGIGEKERIEILADFESPKFQVRDLTFYDVSRASGLSIASNIHIYDYLVALPLRGIISKIYSSDDHFQHPDFKEIAIVENPLYPWILREGITPHK